MSRLRSARYLPAAALAGTAAVAAISQGAVADILKWEPVAGIEQVFTDNVEASPADRDADGVTILSLGVKAELNTSNVIAIADVDALYEEFWATNELDNFNSHGTFAGRGEVIDNILYLDAIAEKSQVYLSPTDGAASGLPTGTSGAVELQSFSAGPLIKLDVLGLADLRVRGTYGHTEFNKPIVGLASTLLSDISIKQAGAKITTGDRSSLYELFGSGEYVETDTDFRMHDEIGGVAIKITPKLAAIGRIGYEDIEDPSFAPIQGTVWSVGGRYYFYHDAEHMIRFEYGHRFGDTSYEGQLVIDVIRKVLHVEATYLETFTPVQMTITRSLEELFDDEGTLKIAEPSKPGIPNPLVPDTIVRDKNMKALASYQYGLQKYTLSVEHLDRFYPGLGDNERTWVVGFALEEPLSRDLHYLADIELHDNYESILSGTPSKVYLARLLFEYSLNDHSTLSGGYVYRLKSAPGTSDAYENVIRLGVTQDF